MSHYTKLGIKAQQKYEAELVQALKKHFGADGVEVGGDSKIPLKMWNGSDSRLKANIVIRKDTLGKRLGHFVAANDLGYERTKEGGYEVHADEVAFPQAHQNLVAQYYAELVATKRLKAQGWAVERKQLQTGEVELTAGKFE